MKIFSLNLEGSKKFVKLKYANGLHHKQGFDIMFFMENKASFDKSVPRVNQLPFPNYHIIPSQNLKGGRWLLWTESTSVEILDFSPFYIHI